MPVIFNPFDGTIQLVPVSTGGGGGGNSFYIMQTPLGTSPTATSATDVLTWTNSDGLIDITGNAGTDTIDLALDLASFPEASSVDTGFLTATDWNAFDAKQPAGNYITALTGDASASGPGSASLTLATVNGAPGSFGSASDTLTATVNGKGLVTALASTPIAVAQSQVTDLVSDLAGKQPTGNYITALTGEGTASGPGSAALTLSTTAVTGKVLTGYAAASGVITAADSILQGLGKAVSSTVTSSTDTRLAFFSGTSGKLIGQATNTTLSAADVLNVSSTGSLFVGTNFGLVNTGTQLALRGGGANVMTIATGNVIIGNNGGSLQFEIGGAGASAGSILAIFGGGTTSASNASAVSLSGGNASGSNTGDGANWTISAGNTSSNNNGSAPGTMTISAGGNSNATNTSAGGLSIFRGGNATSATGVAAAGNAQFEGGSASGSGAGGNAILQGGTSSTGTAGTIQLGRSGSTALFLLHTEVAGAAGAATGTYLRVNINGTIYKLALLAD